MRLVGKTVKVYRNLKHGKQARPLYSIMLDGRVVARRHRVLLADAKFIVHESGRRRVLKTGRKNVHAFVKGRLVGRKGTMGITADASHLNVSVMYKPTAGPQFMTLMTESLSEPVVVVGAKAVLLNENGASIAVGEYLL